MSKSAYQLSAPPSCSRVATRSFVGFFATVALFTAGVVSAVEVPERSGLGEKEFRHSDLEISSVLRLPAELPKGDGARMGSADLAALGVPADRGRLDVRGGRWGTITLAQPLLPGIGVGNEVTWAGLGRSEPGDDAEIREAAAAVFRDYLRRSAVALRLDVGELAAEGVTTVHDGGAIVQLYIPRVFAGVPVRGSYLSAVINHGNLVLFGAHKWGDINISEAPTLEVGEALATLQSHVEPYAIAGSWGKNELIIAPTVREAGSTVKRVKAERRDGRTKLAQGYGHRLAWVVRPSFADDLGHWEGLVDAHSGELLSFEDTNRYAEIKGGVYPVTNDGIVPDGVEQLGWPMPFQDVSTTSGTLTTDTGGNLTATGSMTATFFGPYVNINDNCGADSLTQSGGIDWGGSGGTDCTTPGFGGAGNTHASRTGFYELNRIIEMGRSQLPGNTWLQNRLTANMNINNTCNAFWNGSTVNFYRFGGGCSNTGEIAGVFDHEWGHGLDDNDAFPTISNPSGEGIADIYTALRLNTSCIGRNFQATVCTGNGDPCLTCTGVRDIDYLKRQSGNPHDYTWSNANCGGSVHCVGGVYSEAVWSLWKRKLQSPPYGYDNNTAHEMVSRMTFIGAGAVDTWFSGGPPFGGCGASGGYLNYLAADDDNGNINDGTPHMQAIFDAFNDQEIACNTPTVQDSGCAGVPTAQPSVTTSPGNQQIGLSWGAVSGASSYDVFRTEGVFACDFGKVKIGSVAGTSFTDTGLRNGRDYSYVVVPKSAAACFGPASACATAQPVGVPDFAVSCAPSSLSIAQGDNDTSTCSVISSLGYTGSVGLSCSGNPAGVSCSFAPASVSPPANGSADSTLTVTVSGGQATGTFAFNVVGDDGSATRSSGVSVQVIPAGSNGPQDAGFDPGVGVPKCTVAGSSCDSLALLESRGTLSPPEPNQSNTLDVCNDGSAGVYHSDESNDRIVVSTLDGGNFTEGDTVQVAATVWAWATGTSDTLDLYYTADAMSPSWTFIGSIVPPGGGARTLTAQYVLPAGNMQAVRANFRYQGTASPCSPGLYDDHDDLVFTVDPVCTASFSLPQGVAGGGGWEQISIPCDPGPSNTVAEVVGSNLAGTYGTDWIMYRRDEATTSYVALAATDSLVVGEGYWIKTLLASQSVSVGGTMATLTDIPLTGVAAVPPAGCGTSAGQCNMVGNPHNFDVCWADVLVDDGGSIETLATADPGGVCQTTGTGCIMSRIAHKWTGASYAPFDGTTPGMEGTLIPWDGFWVSANKPGIELRIPATPGGPGLPCGPPALIGGAAGGGGQSGWYVRLIAESGDLRDTANVLGELADSSEGYDAHDLMELDPFGIEYLTIVFPHDDWGERSGNYSSDYRELNVSRTRSWHFQVRSSDEEAGIVLSWEGPPSQLERATLMDLDANEEIMPAPDGSYAFTMEGPTRNFAWVVR